MAIATVGTADAAEFSTGTEDAERKGILLLNTKGMAFGPQHIHAMIARTLDRSRLAVYVALSPDCGNRAEWEAPDTTIWTLPLGTSVTERAGLTGRVRAALGNAQIAIGLWTLARRIRRERIGAIHTGMSPRDALSGLLLSVATGTPLVLHWHFNYWGWYPLVWRLAFRRAAAILAVSEAARGWLVHDLKQPFGKVHVLYNGTDTEKFRPNDGGGVREELGIVADEPVVLMPGRLCPNKGQADLLRAVALLKDRGRWVRALVVGRDDPLATPGGGSHKAELERLTAELGIGDRVLFVEHRSDMPAVMAAADVVTVPSSDDPFPSVVLEAMASARPVIGARSGGIPEQIVDGATGLTVPVNDAHALATALERVVDDPAEARRMGERGRRHVEERFTQERMAADASGFFDRLLRRRARVRQTAAAGA